MKTFVELVVSGQLKCDAIEDFIDQWHDSDSQASLPEYLGMTKDEYALWVEKPASLDLIIQAHAEGMYLEKIG